MDDTDKRIADGFDKSRAEEIRKAHKAMHQAEVSLKKATRIAYLAGVRIELYELMKSAGEQVEGFKEDLKHLEEQIDN